MRPERVCDRVTVALGREGEPDREADTCCVIVLDTVASIVDEPKVKENVREGLSDTVSDSVEDLSRERADKVSVRVPDAVSSSVRDSFDGVRKGDFVLDGDSVKLNAAELENDGESVSVGVPVRATGVSEAETLIEASGESVKDAEEVSEDESDR